MQFFYGEAIVTKMGVLLDEHEEGKSEFWWWMEQSERFECFGYWENLECMVLWSSFQWDLCGAHGIFGISGITYGFKDCWNDLQSSQLSILLVHFETLHGFEKITIFDDPEILNEREFLFLFLFPCLQHVGWHVRILATEVTKYNLVQFCWIYFHANVSIVWHYSYTWYKKLAIFEAWI